jgi:hypothetical protein
MPITLDRINRIIQAAEVFLQRDKVLRARVSHVCALVASNRMSATDAIDEIYTDLRVTPQYHPAENIITNERTRFNLTYKRSIAERERLQRRRAGVPPGLPGYPINPRHQSEPEHQDPFPNHPPTPETQLILDNMEAEDTEVNDWVTEDSQPLPDMEQGLSEHQKQEAEAILEQIRQAREEK